MWSTTYDEMAFELEHELKLASAGLTEMHQQLAIKGMFAKC